MTLTIVPVTFRQACQFIDAHHRHHRPPQGMRLALGVADGSTLVGVATVGRPVARHLDDGRTAEITRTCCADGARNANSMLYAACSLAVLLAKPAARKETVNDLDQELVGFWRTLRDRPDKLIRACALTPHSRAEHARAYQPADDDIEAARRVWVRLTQARSGGLLPTGWKRFLDTAGPRLSMPGYLAGYLARMPAAAARLAAVSLDCRPALVVLSGYPSPLYERLYAGWHRTMLTGSTHRDPHRTEVLWANHTPADAAADHRYAA